MIRIEYTNHYSVRSFRISPFGWGLPSALLRGKGEETSEIDMEEIAFITVIGGGRHHCLVKSGFSYLISNHELQFTNNKLILQHEYPF